jgi:hypothetical protein
LAPRPRRKAEVILEVAAGTREAVGVPAVVAAHISRQPVAAARLISPLALRLTLVEAAHIFPPAYRTVDLLSTPQFTVLRV